MIGIAQPQSIFLDAVLVEKGGRSTGPLSEQIR